MSTNLPMPRGLLRTISSTESHGYGDLYGGGQTTDLSRHPNIPVPITSGPNAGQTSTAAGRYQFLKGTWDAEAAKLGLKDFGPASQDRAAWDDAQGVYRRKTGHDLLADLRSKDPAVRAGIGTALHSEWTSLPGGIEQGQGGSQFAAALDRNTAAQMAAPAAMGTQMAPPAQMAQAATPGVTAADIGGAMNGIIKVQVDHSGNPAPGTNVSVTSPTDGIQVLPGVQATTVGRRT